MQNSDRIANHIRLKLHIRPSYRLLQSGAIVQNLVDGMLKDGIIQESHSPWNSPLFLVPKKDGPFRVLFDFRKLNSVTVPDH